MAPAYLNGAILKFEYMKILRYIAVILFFFLFLGCQTDNEKIRNVEKKSAEDPLSFNDSIVIQGVSYLRFDDLLNDKILLHNPIDLTIYVFDIKHNQLQSFHHAGRNMDDYTLLLDNLKFYNDSIVSVGKIRHINFYHINGNFLFGRKVKRRHKTYAPVMHQYFLPDSVFIFMESAQGDIRRPEFYRRKDSLFTIYHLGFGPIKRFGLFPEEESVYNDKTYYYLYPMLFSVFYDKEKVYTVGANDPNLYVYRLDNGKKQSVYPLNLKHYTPFKVKFNAIKVSDSKEAWKRILQNSTINRLYIHDSLIFIGYDKAYSADELARNKNLDTLRLRACLQIRTFDGKIMYDKQLPYFVKDFLFYRNDSLYFMARPTQESEDRNYTVIYKVKWNAE